MGYDSQVEINGKILRTLVEACGLVQPRVLKMMQSQGIIDINQDEWYPLDQVLSIIEEVADSAGSNILTEIGKRVIRFVDCFSEQESFEQALFTLDQVYKQFHRAGRLGGVQVVEIGPRMYRVEVDTPYAPRFALGILRGLCRQYTMLARLEIVDSELRSGTFQIRW